MIKKPKDLVPFVVHVVLDHFCENMFLSMRNNPPEGYFDITQLEPQEVHLVVDMLVQYHMFLMSKQYHLEYAKMLSAYRELPGSGSDPLGFDSLMTATASPLLDEKIRILHEWLWSKPFTVRVMRVFAEAWVILLKDPLIKQQVKQYNA
jgi:hypothetical protein